MVYLRIWLVLHLYSSKFEISSSFAKATAEHAAPQLCCSGRNAGGGRSN